MTVSTWMSRSSIMRFKITHKAGVRGVGDLVAAVANPIKNAILKHGTDKMRKRLENCKCKERQEKLNRMFPL